MARIVRGVPAVDAARKIVQGRGMLASGLGLELEVPDGWQDRSTLTFALPADAELKDPRLLGKAAPRSAAAMVIGRDEVAGELAAILEERTKGLVKTNPGLRTIGRGDAGTAGAPMPYVELAADQPVAAHQIMVLRRIGRFVYTFTGTAMTKAYPKVRERFLEIARSAKG